MSSQALQKFVKYNTLSNRILIIFITICSVSLFMLKGLGKGERVIELCGSITIIFFLLLFTIYFRGISTKSGKFGVLIIILIVLLFASDFSSLFFNNQAIVIRNKID